MVAVVEEAQGASAAGGIVNHFGHDGIVFAEVQLVANTDFAGGVHEHIPEAEFLIKFAQEEHFDACVRLLLVAIEAGGKHFCVVEHEDVVLVEIVQDVLEHAMLYLAGFSMEHHHAAFVAVGCGILGDFLFGEFVLELGELHCWIFLWVM